MKIKKRILVHNLKKIECWIISILALDTLLLLFLGKAYSKFLLLPPFFYLHDILLISLAFITIIAFPQRENKIRSIELLILLSFGYLILSMINLPSLKEIKIYYTLRQFMLFGYVILIYAILKGILTSKEVKNYLIKFIVLIGYLSIGIQFSYSVFLLIVEGTIPVFERNYFSPLIIMGIMVFGSNILVFYRGLKKYIIFISTLIISFTLGHDSAYLSLIVIFFSYLFIKSSKKLKIYLTIGLIGIIILLLVFVPTFSDVNMQWRLIYWKETLINIFKENYVIFGNGFGVEYVNYETASKLNNLMINAGHPYTIITKEEQYLTAPHNSFLSILFHVGFLGIFLLIYPFFKGLKKEVIFKKDIFFLLLTLIGLTVWSSFNVILELPHSSSFYWLVYFTIIFILNSRIDEK